MSLVRERSMAPMLMTRVYWKKGKTERAHHERLVLWLIHA
jgi:hypothetical protein